jgi:hypothetical protein
MKKQMRCCRGFAAVLLATLVFVVTPSSSLGATCDPTSVVSEGIPYFASDVVVQPNSTTTVRETIRVVAKGQQILNNLYRDLPSQYEDAQGHVYSVDVRVLDVRRDGKPEQYSTTSIKDGTRVYLGAPNAPLATGDYTYTLTYQVVGDLAFHPDRDALYWPVTGSNWTIPIDCVTATVQLPSEVPRIGIHANGWVGPEDTPSRQVVGTIDRGGVTTFVADGPLGLHQGLTISVDWPRGFVREPVAAGQSLPVVGAGESVQVSLLGLALVAVYSLWAWKWVRRGPRGQVVSVDRPPDGLSPAAARFLETGGFDERSLVAAIIGLAVKGYLIIREGATSRDVAIALPARSREETVQTPAASTRQPVRSYDLLKVDGDAGRSRLTPEEGGVLAELFASSSRCRISQENHDEIHRAINELKRLVGALYEDTYFTTNGRYLIPSLLLSLATIVATALAETNRAALSLEASAVWFVVALGLVYATTILLGMALIASRFTSARRRLLFAGLFVAVYLLPLFLTYLALARTARTSPLVVVLLGGLGILLAVLRKLLVTPTLQGRRARERLDGFKAFLADVGRRVQDGDEVPARPDAWQASTAYAVALDMDKGWFAPLARVVTSTGERSGESQPAVEWYQPSGNAEDLAAAGWSLSDALCVAVKDALKGPGGTGSRDDLGGGLLESRGSSAGSKDDGASE